MKKIVRLTENDLVKLVKRVITEHDGMIDPSYFAHNLTLPNKKAQPKSTDSSGNLQSGGKIFSTMSNKSIIYLNKFKEWVNSNYPKLAVKLKISKNDTNDETKLTLAFNYIIKKEDNIWDWADNPEGEKLGDFFMRNKDS